ncbi:hypothetical protein ACFP51_02130 [Streptomyces pratens]|uniref:Uncharacterized protein n=1 Tax=Streptomyces pratens TaxID=887456 RepID=A0ABW1M343_9ACTN
MNAEDTRYQEDLKSPALIAIARQREVIRRAEEEIQKERERLAELVCTATTRTPGNPIPYGRVEHVARLLGVKRDRVAKIRNAVRKSRSGEAERDVETDGHAPPSLPATA